MINTVFETEKMYTVKEAAEILPISDRWVKKLCQTRKLDAITVVANGGEQYRISKSSLIEYAKKNNIILNHSLTPTEQGLASLAPAPVFSLVTSERKYSAEIIPDRAKEIALARLDLLNAWNDFRNKAQKKTQADKDFVILYNAGLNFTELNKLLGKISVGTLYRWQKDYKETGDYTSLVPQYNYRSEFEKETKLSDIERKYFLDLLLQPNEIRVGNAVRLIKYMLEKQGINEICSYATYKRFADWFKSKNYDVWTLMRKGQKALVDKVAPYVERDPSVLNVGDVLVADGHVLDFQVINPFNGKPCRATLVGYVDWKSTELVGYEIMLTENTQCIASALRNAVINLGKMPKICYQDNGRAFRSRFFRGSKSFDECGFYGLFGKLGIVPVFATPYNAKAKIIERFFEEFSVTCEKLLPSYIGNSPVNKPAYMMRNEKFHKKIHNEFVPTIQQAVQLIEAWRDFHRSQPCPNVPDRTIGEVFDEGRGEGVDLDLLDDLLMAEDMRSIGRNGIKFLNSKYWAEELYGFKGRVVIKYSLFDLSYVKVYGNDGGYICKAETVLKVHPMAAILGDQKDVYSLKSAIKKSKKLQQQTINKAKKLLPQLNKELLDWQKGNVEPPAKLTDKKQRKEIEKQYKDIQYDVSNVLTDPSPKNKPDAIPLFDWQMEEMQQQSEQK